MSGQATHEDDAAPVETDHGGQELTQTPDLTHQVHLQQVTIRIKVTVREVVYLLFIH